MWLWGLFSWFEKNPAAQWAAGISAAFATFWAWITLRDRRVKKEAKREVIDKIEATEDKLKEAANEAENRVTADLNTRSLRNVAANSPENLGPVQRDQPR